MLANLTISADYSSEDERKSYEEAIKSLRNFINTSTPFNTTLTFETDGEENEV